MPVRQGFYPSESFDVGQMAAFMRAPEIYRALQDGLSPPPENVLYEEFLQDPKIWTIAAYFEKTIIGFVQFQGKTSVAAELTVAFHPQARGKIAHTFCNYAITEAWKRWLTLFALVPSDNLVARRGCRLLGFDLEGKVTKAITRLETKHRNAGLYDILIYVLHNPRILP